MKELQDLRAKLDETSQAHSQLITLYENQLGDLKQRFLADKKRNEAQIEQVFSITQREAVIKTLKKEMT